MPFTSMAGMSSPGFIVDYNSTSRTDGVQINWDDVDDSRIPAGGTKKVIRAGTVMAQQPDGRVIPRADALAGETAVGLLVSTVTEDAYQDALSGYGMFRAAHVYLDLLPDAEDADLETWFGEIRTAGGYVMADEYLDSRAPAGS